MCSWLNVGIVVCKTQFSGHVILERGIKIKCTTHKTITNEEKKKQKKNNQLHIESQKHCSRKYHKTICVRSIF